MSGCRRADDRLLFVTDLYFLIPAVFVKCVNWPVSDKAFFFIPPLNINEGD